jgi:hypothetical protein
MAGLSFRRLFQEKKVTAEPLEGRCRSVIAPERITNELSYRSAVSLAKVRVADELVANGEHFDRFGPWEHHIFLAGESMEVAHNFTLALWRRFLETEVRKEPAETVNSVLNEVGTEFFSSKRFTNPSLRIHELTYLALPASSREDIVATLNEARVTGYPVEFGYMSAREHFEEPGLQPRLKRVNVKTIDADGFTATHARGLRRYSFSKVSWVLMEKLTARKKPVGPEVMLTLKLEEGRYTNTVDFRLFTQRRER